MRLIHLASELDQRETGRDEELWRVQKGERILRRVVLYLPIGIDLCLFEGEDNPARRFRAPFVKYEELLLNKRGRQGLYQAISFRLAFESQRGSAVKLRRIRLRQQLRDCYATFKVVSFHKGVPQGDSKRSAK